MSPLECTGTVTSDEGWTRPINCVKVYWILNRDIPSWAPCPDGTFASGHQKFTVGGSTPPLNERNLKITTFFAGRDDHRDRRAVRAASTSPSTSSAR